MKAQDEMYMRKALELATLGWGWTSPNPLVGAVVVKDGEIVGSGYHKICGGPHAEVNAIRDSGEKAREACIYVNLEPCCHYGKTPPCTDLIIKSGIKRVVVGMKDPNPQVAGNGIKKLIDAGIEVETGILEAESIALNEIFIKHIRGKSPFVILKTAVTMDGKTACENGDSKWITCEQSRKYVHRLRGRVSCIVTGVGTVIADDPLMNVRHEKGMKDPVRVVMDSKCSIPLHSNVLVNSPENTIVAVTDSADSEKIKAVENTGAKVMVLPKGDKGVDIKSLVEELSKRGFDSILVEAGESVNESFLNEGLVDKIYMFMAPKILTGKDSMGSFGGDSPQKMADAARIYDMKTESVGDDILITGYTKEGMQCLQV